MPEAAHRFRSQFPVLAHAAYLNAGTCGPIPQRAAEALVAAVREETASGRSGEPHFARWGAGLAALRESYAGWLGCPPEAVALTRSTSDGVSTALHSLDLRSGDEVLTSDEEHPGVLAPLAAARRRAGIVVRTEPFDELATAVTSRTRVVCCSHVSWISGRVVDAPGLAASGAVVVLDGAQGLGAVDLDMARLGCDFYAASGQKWMCGPDGSGALYVRPELISELRVPWPSYVALESGERAAELGTHPGARRFDLPGWASGGVAWARASVDVLEEAGRTWVTERGPALAARLAELLAGRGIEVLPRGDSTLVTWRDTDAAATVERLAAEGIIVRDLPGRDAVRASVGAWSTDEELERLVRSATSRP
jgi:L-cysteine/cystine lyase